MIDRLSLWMDNEARDGPSNMAIDEWLLKAAEQPVLRVYRWQPDWGSYGYFVPDAEAAQSLAGMKRVRRWTGGGIVDHRNDWTYTLVLPSGEPLAKAKGAASYRVIHEALAEALRTGGRECGCALDRSVSAGGECFKKAVEYDIVDGTGRKIAGAGQRRSLRGLLHQGSVSTEGNEILARDFGARLADHLQDFEIPLEKGLIKEIALDRYASHAWRVRR
ncbi:lipoyl protein ligase domain-containing protein [Haloferula sp.]|uniref:lipoyl protein ligase domain-containing protein n=1 Tax=Haloferula sp. TaxID=2497595 RepID=UPI003C774A55